MAVAVDEGVVFLSGLVADAAYREHAEEVVRTTEGVRRVENDLRLPAQ